MWRNPFGRSSGILQRWLINVLTMLGNDCCTAYIDVMCKFRLKLNLCSNHLVFYGSGLQLFRCFETPIFVWTKMASGTIYGHHQMGSGFNCGSDYRGIHLWPSTGLNLLPSESSQLSVSINNLM